MKDGLWMLAGVFLLVCACSDVRSGMVSVKCCLLTAGAGILLRILCAQGVFAWDILSFGIDAREIPAQGKRMDEPFWERFPCSLLPGLFVMGLAAGSGEQIGKGDAWILLTLGALVGTQRCVSLFVTGLVISLPFAMVWYLAGRRSNKTMCLTEAGGARSFPFAPSLMIAYMILSIRT